MNNYGWMCPKCETVYAPFVTQCTNSHKTIAGSTTITDTPWAEPLWKGPVTNGPLVTIGAMG